MFDLTLASLKIVLLVGGKWYVVFKLSKILETFDRLCPYRGRD